MVTLTSHSHQCNLQTMKIGKQLQNLHVYNLSLGSYMSRDLEPPRCNKLDALHLVSLPVPHILIDDPAQMPSGVFAPDDKMLFTHLLFFYHYCYCPVKHSTILLLTCSSWWHFKLIFTVQHLKGSSSFVGCRLNTVVLYTQQKRNVTMCLFLQRTYLL